MSAPLETDAIYTSSCPQIDQRHPCERMAIGKHRDSSPYWYPRYSLVCWRPRGCLGLGVGTQLGGACGRCCSLSTASLGEPLLISSSGGLLGLTMLGLMSSGLLCIRPSWYNGCHHVFTIAGRQRSHFQNLTADVF